MALKTSSGYVPEDAVRMDAHEALIYQWKQIRNWPKLSDVWPFRIGLPCLAGLAAFSGWRINHGLRRKLKLHNYGLGSTQFAMTLTPAIIVAGVHIFSITHDMFLGKTECCLCAQHEAVLIQVSGGIAYPLVMSPLANFMFSSRHGTYRLPYWADWRENGKLWLKLVKPMRGTLLNLLLVQAVSAAFITYMEMSSLNTVRDKLIKFEEELLNEQKILLSSSK